MSAQKPDTSVLAQVPASIADSRKVRLGGAYTSLTSVRFAPVTKERDQTLSSNQDVMAISAN